MGRGLNGKCRKEVPVRLTQKNMSLFKPTEESNKRVSSSKRTSHLILGPNLSQEILVVSNKVPIFMKIGDSPL